MFRNTSIIKKDKEKIDELSEMNSINLDALPPEILNMMATLLSDKDLANLSRVNKGMNSAVQHEIEERFKMMMTRLDNEYKKIHDDNKSLQEGVETQLVADSILCQRLMRVPMSVTCGFRDVYAGEAINDRNLRINFSMGILGIYVSTLALMMTELLLLIINHSSDNDETVDSFAPDFLILLLFYFFILLPIMVVTPNVPLMLRMCRNGSDYAMSSLSLFSGRRREARLANRIEDLEQRMEAGEANIHMDVEEFNTRLQDEPYYIAESASLLAAHP